MDNSPRSNGPQVISTKDGEDEIDYKQRCKYLENQLEKFREQAAKVREVIGQKVRGTVLDVLCSVVCMLRLKLLNRIRTSLSYLIHCYCFHRSFRGFV